MSAEEAREARARAAVMYPWLAVPLGLVTTVEAKWAGDRCCVCDSDVDYDDDQLVACSACSMTVHQRCYGITQLPDAEQVWLCDPCKFPAPEGKPAAQCCLCPVTGGALKEASIKGLWVHCVCAQWIPGMGFENPETLSPICGVEYVERERWRSRCCICKESMGAKINCQHCILALHPLCARMAGLTMELQETGNAQQPFRHIVKCYK